jgi:hypothetical protein
MKKIVCLLVLVGVMLGGGSVVGADDGIYVIGGAGRVGTAITRLPYAITQPGFYYLNGNLTLNTPGYGITVQASNVTIDLMGFCMTGPGSTNGNFAGIGIYGGYSHVEIRNGHITNWTGTGPNAGKAINGSGTSNNRVIGVDVSNCGGGIFLGSYGLAASCTIANITEDGLTAQDGSAVKGNNLSACAPNGIRAYSGCLVDGNTVSNLSNGTTGIKASDRTTVTNNVVNVGSLGTGITVGYWCTIKGNTSFVPFVEIPSGGIITLDSCIILNNTATGIGHGSGCLVLNNTP